MDISALSNVSNVNLKSQVSVQVAKETLDATKQQGEAVVELIKSAGSVGSDSTISSPASIGSIVWQGYLGGWVTVASIFVTYASSGTSMIVTSDQVSISAGAKSIAPSIWLRRRCTFARVL